MITKFCIHKQTRPSSAISKILTCWAWGLLGYCVYYLCSELEAPSFVVSLTGPQKVVACGPYFRAISPLSNINSFSVCCYPLATCGPPGDVGLAQLQEVPPQGQLGSQRGGSSQETGRQRGQSPTRHNESRAGDRLPLTAGSSFRWWWHFKIRARSSSITHSKPKMILHLWA